MLNLRYIIRLTYAFLARFKILIFIGIGFGIVIFFLLKFLMPFLSGRSTDRIGLTGRYNTVNLPQKVLEQIGDGLTKLDDSGNVEPGLATSWETIDKGKTWIFTLNENIYWQDGKKVEAKDILYQFSDVSIEYPDQKTIVFKLQNPYSAFPAIVSKPTFRKGLLGTGEWEVKGVTVAGSNVERLNLQKMGGKEKIIYKFYPTEERTKLAFKLGEVDKIREILNPEPFNTWKRVKINKQDGKGEYVAIFLNTKDSLLADKSLRQALGYGIKKDSLPGERSISPISIESWAYNPQVKPYNFDFEKAKSIVDEYKKQSQTTEVPIILSTTPSLLSQAESISKDWSEIGLKVSVQVSPNIPTEYQAFLAIFDTPGDPDQYTVWHSTQTSTNITKYEDPRIDKLLEDGRAELDFEARRKIYLDFQRFLVEDSPALFLYYPSSYDISRN